MATAAARCCSCCWLQLQLQRCMAVASAVGTGFVPRASVVRRSMFDVTSTCAMWQPPRCRPTTFALMCADAIVLTDFMGCAHGTSSACSEESDALLDPHETSGPAR